MFQLSDKKDFRFLGFSTRDEKGRDGEKDEVKSLKSKKKAAKGREVYATFKATSVHVVR